MQNISRCTRTPNFNQRENIAASANFIRPADISTVFVNMPVRDGQIGVPPAVIDRPDIRPPVMPGKGEPIDEIKAEFEPFFAEPDNAPNPVFRRKSQINRSERVRGTGWQRDSSFPNV